MALVKDVMRTEYPVVELDDSISSMLGHCKKYGIHSAVVLSEGVYAGMIDELAARRKRIDAGKAKVKGVIKHRSKGNSAFFVPELDKGEPLISAAKKLLDANTHALPVMRGSEVIGVVTRQEVGLALAKGNKTACANVATMNAIVLQDDAPIQKAIALMSNNGIEHVPVVDAKGVVLGVVSLSDLVEHDNLLSLQKQRGNGEKGKPSGASGKKTKQLALPLRNVVSGNDVVSIAPNAKLADAVKLMERAKVSSVILMEFGRPVGILTIHDILRHLVG